MKKDFISYFGKKIVVFIPFFFLILFFFLPLLIILRVSLADPLIAKPPFSDIIYWTEQAYLTIKLSFQSYLNIFSEFHYLKAFITSLQIAFFSTLICLIIGYPMAYAISKIPPPWRLYILFFIILPFWTSFLIRIYAWIGLLKDNGFINNLLLFFNIIDEPIELLYNKFSVYIGIIYSYLPFMILTLHSNLTKIEPILLEAAADLGAKSITTFRRITLPLSLPGIMAGSMLVFIPAIGEFVIPDLLGGSDIIMIGKTIWTEFFTIHDWPTASALSITTLFILLIPILIFQYFQSKEESE